MVHMADGVDVSRHQASINWGAARGGGVEFAYIKVTEGVGYVDPKVDQHLSGARLAGVVTGLYHFARPDTNGAAADAAHFAAQVNKRDSAGPGNLPPCLDLEERTRGSLAGINLEPWVAQFLAEARRLTGRRQFMLYASASFLRDRLKGMAWLDQDCLIWVAHYGRDPGSPGWRDGRTVMHQYTSTGRIPGYGSNIDRNVAWVPLADLTQGAVAPGPPGPPPDGVYVVQPGDSLGGIAAKLNYPGGWRALHAANIDIIGVDPDRIFPGQRLRTTLGAAPAQPEWYRVAAGDSLTKIAQKLNVAGGWRAIFDANRDTIDDPDVVFAGQRIRIPR